MKHFSCDNICLPGKCYLMMAVLIVYSVQSVFYLLPNVLDYVITWEISELNQLFS